METRRTQHLQESYDRVAGEYVARIYDELQHKPLDRQLLDRLAERVRDLGPVCDLGCGPGQVAVYLHGRGVDVCGIDISPGMVEQARRLNPGLPFHQGDMRALKVEDNAWGGIAAFYAVLHIPREELITTFREFRRVLRPGGWLLLTFHIGEEIRHLDAWWGEQVDLDFLFFRTDEMVDYLDAAGFAVAEVIEREPYPDVEVPTRRAYIFAQKTGADLTHPRLRLAHCMVRGLNGSAPHPAILKGRG